jgi:hypothetical protein
MLRVTGLFLLAHWFQHTRFFFSLKFSKINQSMASLRTLPKARDKISFLYFEHCRIEQDDRAITIFKEKDKFLGPCAAITTLLLGRGTLVTHADIKLSAYKLLT